jgi:hypothetical protein
MLTELEDRIDRELDFQASLEDLETLQTVSGILDAIDMAWDDDAPMIFFLIAKVRLMAAMSLINGIQMDLYLNIPDELKQEYDYIRSEVLESFKDVEEKLSTFNN